MRQETIEIRVLTASDGMVLTNGETYSTKVFLGIHDKVNTGATGAAGQNAVVFTVYAPNGTTFVNRNGTLPLNVQAYSI